MLRWVANIVLVRVMEFFVSSKEDIRDIKEGPRKGSNVLG
jgi:hypothetical protein